MSGTPHLEDGEGNQEGGIEEGDEDQNLLDVSQRFARFYAVIIFKFRQKLEKKRTL